MNNYEETMLQAVLESPELSEQSRLIVLSIIGHMRINLESWAMISEGTNHDPRCRRNHLLRQRHQKPDPKGWLCLRCENEDLKRILRDCADTLKDENIRSANNIEGLIALVDNALKRSSFE